MRKIVIVFALFFSSPLAAQEAASKFLWLSTGVGTGAHMAVAGGKARWYAGVDVSYTADGFIFIEDAITSFSLLGGARLLPNNKKMMVSFGGGLSYVRYQKYASFSFSGPSKPKPLPETSLGIHTEFDVVWRFSKHVGIGTKLQGNLNGARSFGNILLCLHVGKLR